MGRRLLTLHSSVSTHFLLLEEVLVQSLTSSLPFFAPVQFDGLLLPLNYGHFYNSPGTYDLRYYITSKIPLRYMSPKLMLLLGIMYVSVSL